MLTSVGNVGNLAPSSFCLCPADWPAWGPRQRGRQRTGDYWQDTLLSKSDQNISTTDLVLWSRCEGKEVCTERVLVLVDETPGVVEDNSCKVVDPKVCAAVRPGGNLTLSSILFHSSQQNWLLLWHNKRWVWISKNNNFTLVWCSWDESHAWCASLQPESGLSPEKIVITNGHETWTWWHGESEC